MKNKILIINPGSTSTKIAVYDGDKLDSYVMRHDLDIMVKYKSIADQAEYRYREMLGALEANWVNLDEITAVVGRGGMLPPVDGGAYLVNDKLYETLKFNPVYEHACNLGGILAYEFGQKHGLNAYIYDCVSVDEYEDIARVSGTAGMERRSSCHVLNSRAVAIDAAEEAGVEYGDMNYIVAHIGGGISISAHKKGLIVDNISDDEGPFSIDRCGQIPTRMAIDCVKEYGGSINDVRKELFSKSGIYGYLGTADMMEVEERISQGDDEAKLIFEAMAYQVAKSIGELATVLKGNVDNIVLTGGISNSKRFVGLVKERVDFISPVVIKAGEFEMEALAKGCMRVLEKKEEAKVMA